MQPECIVGHLLVFFIQYFETFLVEFGFYTVFPCYILLKSRVDYYQLWSDNKQGKVIINIYRNSILIESFKDKPHTFYMLHPGFSPRDSVMQDDTKYIVVEVSEDCFDDQSELPKKV